MAPTAAMLILSRHCKTTSPALPPPPPSPPLDVKASALKWVALDSLLTRRGRCRSNNGQESKMVEADRSFSADSALEKRFKEALEYSWW